MKPRTRIIVSVDLGGKAGVQTPFDDADIATEEKEEDDDEDNDEGASALLNLPFFTDDVFFSFFSFFFCSHSARFSSLPFFHRM